MSKPAKLVSSKNLSNPAGSRDVSFGASTPERRQSRDFSKSGIETSTTEHDDTKERHERWRNGLNRL